VWSGSPETGFFVSMAGNRFYSALLILIAVVLGYLSYEILKPFLSPIAWAIVFSIVFYPVYAFMVKYVKWKPLASVLTICVILLAILGPFSYLSYQLTQELITLVNHVEGGQYDPLKTVLAHPLINSVLSKVLATFNITEAEFQRTIIENISRLGKESVGLIKSGLGNAVSVALDFVLMLLTIFFLLTDGPVFFEKIGDYLPFSPKQKEKLIAETKGIVVSTIYGGITVAVAQGIIGGIAFSVLGIPSPVVWGLAMFVCSFIPLFGTFLIWGPGAVYLFAHGSIVKAIILILIGVVGISSVDNILRPLILRGKMKLPTLAIFFSILGGIKLFGFIGLIMGPLVLALFVSVAEILRLIEGQEKQR
jgi:predicted PurR-regulated permease PerM